MLDDDEGEIIDCKVVHGFRWYKLRVTTRAVSTEVRVKLSTWGKARAGGGGHCCLQGVSGIACMKGVRFLFAQYVSEWGDGV